MTGQWKSTSLIAAATALLLVNPSAFADKLVVAADVGFAPHVMAKPGGGYEGYK